MHSGEAPGYSGTNSKVELTGKLIHTYDPSPYVLGMLFSLNALALFALLFTPVCLGYFAVGTDVTLVAISPALNMTELAEFNLSLRPQRVRMVAYIIEMCSIIQALRTFIGWRGFGVLFNREIIYDIKCSNLLTMTYRTGVVIEVGASAVSKTYPPSPPSSYARVTHLKTIYELLERKSVPNVDSLYSASQTRGVVYLQPRGLDTRPKIAHDVVDAIVCPRSTCGTNTVY